MNKPLISVVVPIYKTENYLRACIDSLVNQTLDNYEVVLVDDGSPDNCPAICDEYAQKYDFIKVVHKPNGGSVSARKEGVIASSGEYVTFVDSDDLVLPDFLKAKADIILSSKVDVVVENITQSKAGKEDIIKQTLPLGFYDKKSLQEKIYPIMLSTKPFFTFGIFPSACTKCIKREIVLDAQKDVPNEINIGDDGALTYKCLLQANSLFISDSANYVYRINDSSMTQTYVKNMPNRILSLVSYLNEFYPKREYNLDKQIQEYTAFLCIWLVTNELNSKDKIKDVCNRLSLFINHKYVKNCFSGLKVPFREKLIVNCVKKKRIIILKIIRRLLRK